jgi:beta-lactamase class D
VERDGRGCFFATNIAIGMGEDAAARLSITQAILRDLGLIEG